jgi:hypothetical protein
VEAAVIRRQRCGDGYLALRELSAILALSVLAGCTVDQQDPEPQAATPSSRSAHPSDCEGPQIALKTSVGERAAVAAVSKVSISGSHRTEQDSIDDPITPVLTWASPPLTSDESVWAMVAEQGGIRVPGPGLDDARAVVMGLQNPSGTFIGYAGAIPVTITVTVTCPDGRSATGDVTSWTSSQVGVITCTGKLPANSPAIAEDVFSQFC